MATAVMKPILNSLSEPSAKPASKSASKPTSKTEQELRDFEAVFAALSHASRRVILVVLNSRGGKMTAGEIAKSFSCAWPTTTRHLKVLEAAGLVHVWREGREIFYALDRERLKIIENWMNWFR